MSKRNEPSAGPQPAPQGEDVTQMKSPWKIVIGFAAVMVLLIAVAFLQRP